MPSRATTGTGLGLSYTQREFHLNLAVLLACNGSVTSALRPPLMELAVCRLPSGARGRSGLEPASGVAKLAWCRLPVGPPKAPCRQRSGHAAKRAFRPWHQDAQAASSARRSGKGCTAGGRWEPPHIPTRARSLPAAGPGLMSWLCTLDQPPPSLQGLDRGTYARCRLVAPAVRGAKVNCSRLAGPGRAVQSGPGSARARRGRPRPAGAVSGQ